MTENLPQRLAAEALGTALLVATVVGSGIMATVLTKDVGLQLLANTLPTGAILVVLITIFGPVSGAHFNPAVSLVFALRRELPWGELAAYTAVQCAGGIAGTALAHLMFGLPAIEIGTQARATPQLWLAEAVAAFTLVLAILGTLRARPEAVPVIVGLTITAAYWFTASTSFANPAVTLARGFTTSFAGIRLSDVPAFAVMQVIGALAGMGVAGFVFARKTGRQLRTDPMDVVIHHNPDCGTSRNVLKIVEAVGYAPVVIEYLKTGWTRPQLLGLFAAAGLTPRDALRTTKSPAEALGLLDPSVGAEALLDAMIAHPVLVNRPIVCTPKGVRLCRPSETVLDLLDRLPPGPLAKEDGSPLIDADGRRVG